MTAPAPSSPLLQLRGVSKTYGPLTAVQPLDLDVLAGDFFAILGPSGCGKTTLLRMIGGFIPATTGRILIEGRDVTGLPPERRPTNMVFQGYGLFPHMTVRQNIAYGPRIAGTAAAEVTRRVDEAIALVHLDGLADRATTALSGGQQQRVALARALVMRPPVLLLDEPLAALDLKLRQAMQDELRRIHAQIGGTFVFVTHDQGEAMSLANRVAVMDGGHVLQVGSPEAIYRSPTSPFVATFVGDANLFRGKRRGGEVSLDIGARFANAGPDGEVRVVVRPEAIAIARGAGPDAVRVAGTLKSSLFLGSIVRLVVELADGTLVTVQTASSDRGVDGVSPGDTVEIAWPRGSEAVLEG